MARQMPPKSREKTSSETSFNPGKNGGRLRVGGKPGNKGGGRTAEEFKLACQQLASSAERFALAKRVLDDPDTYPSLWLGALKWATEHGYGKPKETVHHEGEIRHGVVILPAIKATVASESAKKHGKTLV